MRFDYEYVTKRLAPSGFVCRFIESSVRELILTRKCGDELFERVAVKEGWQPGFRGYIVGGRYECAIVPGPTFLKGMGETEPLLEIAADPTLGRTHIKKNDEFRRWADRLAEVAPARAAELSERIGPRLLSDTRPARDACARFAERCLNYGDMQKAKAAIESQASPEQLKAVRSMLREPPVMIDDGLIYYEVAALAMILYARELDEDPGWLALPDPDEDRRVMVRLQILASRLAREPGW